MPAVGSIALTGPAPSRDLTGALLDGRYRVERRLGSGGMGTVWAVEHVESLQRLALKTLDVALDEPLRERFLREARAAGALETRHVVRVTDARMGYVHDGDPLPFLVMELLRGESLADHFAARGPLSPGEVVWITRQVGHALGRAHARGIVHRDLKPSNLFLTFEDGEPLVKLCDFGVAKLVGEAGLSLARTDAPTTGTSAVLGTPLYMAPEQLRAHGRVEPATDQWALALVVHRALTDCDYFGDAGTLTELVLRIAQDPLPPPTTLDAVLPGAFDGWFLRSLARSPGERFRDVRSQVAALEAALGRPRPVPVRPRLLGAGPGAVTGSHISPTGDVSAAVIPPRTLARPRGGEAARLPGRGRTAALAVLVLISGAALLGIAGPLPRLLARPAPAGSTDATITAAVSLPSLTDPIGVGPEPSTGRPAPARPPVVVPVVAARPSASSAVPLAPRSAASTLRASPAAWQPTAPAAAVPRASAASRQPVVPASAAPRPSPGRLPAGAACSRSAECASALCVAESCR